MILTLSKAAFLNLYVCVCISMSVTHSVSIHTELTRVKNMQISLFTVALGMADCPDHFNRGEQLHQVVMSTNYCSLIGVIDSARIKPLCEYVSEISDSKSAFMMPLLPTVRVLKAHKLVGICSHWGMDKRESRD